MDITLADILQVCRRKSGTWRPSEPIYLRLAPPVPAWADPPQVTDSQLRETVDGASLVIDMTTGQRVIGIEIVPDPVWLPPLRLS